MKQLDTANILAGVANLRVPPGQYGGFMLRVAGTNQVAQTLTTTNCGLITASWRNVNFTSVRFVDLALMNAREGGVVEATSTAGGAIGLACFLPASWNGDGNVFDCTQDDNVLITVDLSGVTGTIVASGTITLFGIPQEGAMAYLPRITTQTGNVPASGNQNPVLGVENITHLFINTLTNLDRVQVNVDSVAFVQSTVAELLALSNFDSVVETAVTTNILIRFNRARIVNEMLADNIDLQLYAGSGGAAAPQLVSVWCDFSPDIYARSKATVTNRLDTRIARKRMFGKNRAVAVVEQLTGKTAA